MNAGVGDNGGGNQPPEDNANADTSPVDQLLTGNQNFALLLILAVSLPLVFLVNIVVLAYGINGFPFEEIIGLISLLILIIWSRMRILASVSVIVIASLVMAEDLFRDTYSSLANPLFGVGGIAEVSESSMLTIEFTEADKLALEFGGTSALHELDERYQTRTVDLMLAISAATLDRSGGHFGDAPVNRFFLELVSANSLLGPNQAEILRVSTRALAGSSLIQCNSQSAFERVSRTIEARQVLHADINSCQATDQGHILARQLASGLSETPSANHASLRSFTASYIRERNTRRRHSPLSVIPPEDDEALVYATTVLGVGEVDVIPLETTPGARYHVSVVASDRGGDPVIALFSVPSDDGGSIMDSHRTLIDFSDDAGGTLNSFIEFTAVSNVTYEIEVQDYLLRELGYQFCFREVAANEIAAATPVCVPPED